MSSSTSTKGGGVKLVQMPSDLLHIEEDSLPTLGVNGELLAQFEGYRSATRDRRESLAILAPRQMGTRELLMVLARQVGAALRNQNIRLRDTGGDLKASRQKLCYLPGGALGDALRSKPARQALEREAACFIQDLETAWPAGNDIRRLPPDEFLALLDLRDERALPTFLTAAPERLPPHFTGELRHRMLTLEVPVQESFLRRLGIDRL